MNCISTKDLWHSIHGDFSKIDEERMSIWFLEDETAHEHEFILIDYVQALGSLEVMLKVF